jgi:hypothetical protein
MTDKKQSAPVSQTGAPSNSSDENHTQKDYSTLNAALQYAAQDFFVLPCKGKIPLTEHGKDDATTDPGQIKIWWKKWPKANVAINLEKSGLFALDADNLESWERMKADHGGTGNLGPVQITPRKGNHFIWVWPEGLAIPAKVNAFADLGYSGLDLRSKSYIVLAPSRIDGKPYTWLPNHGPDSQICPPPGWLVELIHSLHTSTLAPAKPSLSTDNHGKLSRLTLEFMNFGAGEGERNDRLFRAACDMAGCGFSQSEAETKLLPAATQNGTPEREALATIKSAFTKPRIPAIPHSQEAPMPEIHPMDDSLTDRSQESQPPKTDTIPPELSLVNIPDLPREARLTDKEIAQSEKSGEWINTYTNFAKQALPMTPPEHSRFYAYILAATAIARRVVWKISTEEIYPNLYGLLIAPSGDSKSGGPRLASRVLRGAKLYPLTLPGYMSPQGFLQELIGKPPEFLQDVYTDEIRNSLKLRKDFAAQRLLLLDEVSILFEWFGQSNMAGMKQMVLRLYDCPPDESETTVGRGNGVARNIYLNICGISTQTDMGPFFKQAEHWGNGVWSRFAFITPTWTKPPYVCFPPELELPESITGLLEKLFNKLPKPQEGKLQAHTILIPQKVFERWQVYDKAVRYDLVYSDLLSNRFKSNYKRFPMLAMKLAMIAATLDWIDSDTLIPHMELKHLYSGMIEAESYRASLHRLLETPNRDGQEESLESKIIRLCPAFGSRIVITEREIAIAVNLTDQDERFKLKRQLDQMGKDGVIMFKQKVDRQTKSGRTTKVDGYCKP